MYKNNIFSQNTTAWLNVNTKEYSLYNKHFYSIFQFTTQRFKNSDYQNGNMLTSSPPNHMQHIQE